MMNTAADSPARTYIIFIALLASCNAFKKNSSEHVSHLISQSQDESPAQRKELDETKHDSIQEKAQPYFFPKVDWPEMRETSQSQDNIGSANISQRGQLQSVSEDLSWSNTARDENLDVEDTMKVMCLDWSDLAERGYVILNMMKNLNCEEFRVNHGTQLLKNMDQAFPTGSWLLYLSKPTYLHHQLLINVASDHGIIITKDLLHLLGEMRNSLVEVGIQNFSAANSCQPLPCQAHSNYGELFVILVIIGSVCMVFITSGFIYICWQKRLPTHKTTFHPEGLHFVENGCHDNHVLDVATDCQPQMQEKKLNTNGFSVGRNVGEDSNQWQVFINQAAAEEEEEEQDTHL